MDATRRAVRLVTSSLICLVGPNGVMSPSLVSPPKKDDNVLALNV